MGLGGARVRIGQGTWKTEVKVAVAERDRLMWQEGIENKSTLEKYRSKEEKSFEEWLDREEGRAVFNIRAGSLGLRNRTGRTAQDKTCQKCKEGEVENEQHVVLKCPAYRVERNRMLRKVRRIWGEERWGGGGGLDGQRRREAAQGDSRFGWGPIGGVSQNGGKRGEENDEGKRGVKKGNETRVCCMLTCFKSPYNTVSVGSY